MTITFGKPGGRLLLVQCVDQRESESLLAEYEEIKALTHRDDFVFRGICIEDWNKALSPWEAPPVFGKEGFAGEAGVTLTLVQEKIKSIKERYALDPSVPVILGGYSLSALFALWACYKTADFSACAAASPSVWFPGWDAFAEKHSVQTDAVYLSLGDTEERTRNAVMKTVGDAIRRQESRLKAAGVPSVLEWNVGNHFQEPDIRTAKAFAWCIKALEKKGIV